MNLQDISERELLKYNITGDKLKLLIITKYRKNRATMPYAKLASLFDFVLVDDSICDTAAVYPGMGKIIVNGLLSNKQLDAVVKHEMMHEWYNHLKRLEEYCIDKYDKLCAWLKYDATDAERKDKNIKSIMQRIHRLSNFAGDYDISNRAYTEADKDIFRALIHGSDVLRCLVTDDDHPDWVNLSYAEMMDKIVDEEMSKPVDQQNQNGLSGQQSLQQGQQGLSGQSNGLSGSSGGNPQISSDDDDEQFYTPDNDVEVIDGEYVDEDTFLDSNGNPIIDESLEVELL